MHKNHIIEIEPRKPGQSTGPMVEVATAKAAHTVAGAVSVASVKARELLAEHDEIASVAVYHSYPSPGPRRRYVGLIERDQ